MATSPLPSSERIPGTYQFIELQRSGGLANLPASICLIGHRLNTAAATYDNIVVELASRNDARSKYGSGSQLDLMARAAFSTGPTARRQNPIGGVPKIFAISVPPPVEVGDAAAVYTQTITGTPTSNGVLRLYVGDQTFAVGVLSTDTPTTVAAAAVAALDLAAPDMFVTAGSAAGVLTLTAREKGTAGNDVVVHADAADAPGLSVATAQTVIGVGVVSLEAALTASLGERFESVVVAQNDAQTLTDAAAHIESAWAYDTDRRRVLYLGHEGDWSDAQTSAATLDDYRISVVSAEKTPGAGPPPFDFENSARSMASQCAAAVASINSSQAKPNYNFNLAPVPVLGRPAWSRSALNDTIAAGVLALIVEDGQTKIADPVSTAVTDQTGLTASPDTSWQPLEIPKTVRAISEQMRLVLQRYSSADQDLATLARSKGAALQVLREAAKQGRRWIADVTDASVTTSFVAVGGRTDLVIDLDYTVLVGVDAVVVTHRVSQPTNA